MQCPRIKGALAASIALVLSMSSIVQAQSAGGSDALSTRINMSSLTSNGTYSRFIIRYRDSAPTTSVAAAQNAGAAMTRAVGLQSSLATARPQVNYRRRLASGAHLVTTSRKLTQTEAAAFMQSIASDPTVAYVEPDVMLRAIGITAPASFTPNDPYFAKYQTDYLPGDGSLTTAGNSVANWGGTNVTGAWQLADGTGMRTAGGTGDVSLYVKAGGTPTSTSNDGASVHVGNAESVSVTRVTSATTYYMRVVGVQAYSGVTVQDTVIGDGASMYASTQSIALGAASFVGDLSTSPSRIMQGTAMGYGASVQASYGTAFGSSSQVTGQYGTAAGNGALVSGANGVALGAAAISAGMGSTALGSNAQAQGANSVVIAGGQGNGGGAYSGPNSSGTVVIGYAAEAVETKDGSGLLQATSNSIVIGSNAISYGGASGIAIGNTAGVAQGSVNAIGIGTRAIGYNDGSIAIGTNTYQCGVCHGYRLRCVRHR